MTRRIQQTGRKRKDYLEFNNIPVTEAIAVNWRTAKSKLLKRMI